VTFSIECYALANVQAFAIEQRGAWVVKHDLSEVLDDLYGKNA